MKYIKNVMQLEDKLRLAIILTLALAVISLFFVGFFIGGHHSESKNHSDDTHHQR